MFKLELYYDELTDNVYLAMRNTDHLMDRYKAQELDRTLMTDISEGRLATVAYNLLETLRNPESEEIA